MGGGEERRDCRARFHFLRDNKEGPEFGVLVNVNTYGEMQRKPGMHPVPKDTWNDPMAG